MIKCNALFLTDFRERARHRRRTSSGLESDRSLSHARPDTTDRPGTKGGGNNLGLHIERNIHPRQRFGLVRTIPIAKKKINPIKRRQFSNLKK